MALAWQLVQGVYAMLAWTLAARAVYRSARLTRLLSASGLVEALLSLRTRADYETGQLAHLLGEPALEALEDAAEQPTVEQLVSRAQTVKSRAMPPARLLRALATVGTSMGFLGAVVLLHGAMAGPETSGAVGAATVARAFDSAVLGFVTGLPCWSALLLCRSEGQQQRRALDRVTLVLGTAVQTQREARVGLDADAAAG